MLSFNLAVSSYFSAIALDLTLDILHPDRSTPLYIAGQSAFLGLFVLGTIRFVFPEYIKVLASNHAASRTPRAMMNLGLTAIIPSALVIPAVYNIAFEVFQTEIPYPPALALILRIALTSGATAIGAGAFLSERRRIPSVEEPPFVLTLGKLLVIPGFFGAFLGLALSTTNGLLGLMLLTAATPPFSIGWFVRRKERKTGRSSTPSHLGEWLGAIGVIMVLWGLPLVVFLLVPGLLITVTGAGLYAVWFLHRNFLKED